MIAYNEKQEQKNPFISNRNKNTAKMSLNRNAASSVWKLY